MVLLERQNLQIANQMQVAQDSISGSIKKKERRYDIDWLRVILFALLIWFHYAVFSLGQLKGETSKMEIFNFPLFIILGIMHQWRLAALFVISGMGTAFAFRRRTWITYLKERAIRLGIPLLFGTYILFMGLFDPINSTKLLFTIFPGSETMPYAHLWFIYNLLIYSIILTPIFAIVRKNPEGFVVSIVRKVINIPYGVGLMIIPSLLLSLNAIMFKPWAFGEVGMWWEFPRYMMYFFFGYLLICAKDDYFKIIDKIRIPVSISIPILSFLWYIANETSSTPNIMAGGWVQDGFEAFSKETIIASFIQEFHAWFWCLFVFSWASKLLNKPSKKLAYLNEAVYPTYIVHMHLTFLPIAVFGLLGLGYYLGMAIGTILVMIGVMVCFEIVRRTRFTRVLFGIKGGREELAKIYPYNIADEKSTRIIIEIIAYILSFIMTIGLIIMLIGAGILSGW